MRKLKVKVKNKNRLVTDDLLQYYQIHLVKYYWITKCCVSFYKSHWFLFNMFTLQFNCFSNFNNVKCWLWAIHWIHCLQMLCLYSYIFAYLPCNYLNYLIWLNLNTLQIFWIWSVDAEHLRKNVKSGIGSFFLP